jgi:hypothetical protein
VHYLEVGWRSMESEPCEGEGVGVWGEVLLVFWIWIGGFVVLGETPIWMRAMWRHHATN